MERSRRSEAGRRRMPPSPHRSTSPCACGSRSNRNHAGSWSLLRRCNSRRPALPRTARPRCARRSSGRRCMASCPSSRQTSSPQRGESAASKRPAGPAILDSARRTACTRTRRAAAPGIPCAAAATSRPRPGAPDGSKRSRAVVERTPPSTGTAAPPVRSVLKHRPRRNRIARPPSLAGPSRPPHPH